MINEKKTVQKSIRLTQTAAGILEEISKKVNLSEAELIEIVLKIIKDKQNDSRRQQPEIN